MTRTALDVSGLCLCGLAFVLAGILVLAGVGVTVASLVEDCGGESFEFGTYGEVIEHKKFDCDRSPELVPYGLAVIGGAGLAAWGLVTGNRRPYLGHIAVVFGALPALPLIAVTVLGVVPYLLIPMGILGIALRSVANVRPLSG